MKIFNKTQKTIISDKGEYLKNSVEKSLGLILNPKQDLIFKTRFGIHTFFLKKYIDILILDKNKKVVKVKPELKPWRVFFWNPKFDLVLELDSGSVARSKTKVGDIIGLEV